MTASAYSCSSSPLPESERLRFFSSASIYPLLALSLCLPVVTLLCQAQVKASNDPPAASIQPDHGTLSNRAITAEWHLHGGHLTGLSLSHTGSPQQVEVNGPFTLQMKDGRVVRAADFSLTTPPHVEQLSANPSGARYSDRLRGVAVRYRMTDPQGQFDLQWSLILRDGSRYIRQVLTITAADKPLEVTDVVLVDIRSSSIRMAGTVKGSPLTDGDFFAGFEHPLSQSSVVGDHAVSELRSGVPIGSHLSATYSAVIGIAAPGQMRRSFLDYLERERAHPYRTFLHYNSWFDIGFFSPYSQEDALNRIEAFGTELHQKRAVVLDSFLFDDGWDDHQDLWKIRPDFKDGFLPLKQAAARYGTAPGVWLSPWGGYGPPKDERVATGRKEGYEIVDGGLALSGPKYYARFHQAATEMVTKYGINQFKFDGTGNADQVVKGSAFSSDFDAAIHLIRDLRKIKPDLFINLTTGTYPSPFWLFDADSIWRGGDDTEFLGVGSSRERWITYRDADTYDEIVKGGPLFPLNSLMLHGIVYAQRAPHLSDDPGHDFANEVHSYFGSGTQLQELYITPALLKPEDWDTLAEAAKWSRKNASVLVDTHWIGGDPRWLEVYGWASWSQGKGILTLRNPSDQPQTFTLDAASAFELPPGAARQYKLRSPWSSEAAQPSVTLTAATPHTFTLAPFEVITLETNTP